MKTVRDLIHALLNAPDPESAAQVRVNVRDEVTGIITWVHVDITDIDQDDGTVLLDTDEIPGRL